MKCLLSNVPNGLASGTHGFVARQVLGTSEVNVLETHHGFLYDLRNKDVVWKAQTICSPH